MDPAHPPAPPAVEFFRIRISPDPTVWSWLPIYVLAVAQPRQENGRTVYGIRRFTHEKAQAEVFPTLCAQIVMLIVQNSCPTATLEPATFAEWIEAAKPPRT